MAFIKYQDIEEALPTSHDRAKIIRKLEDIEDSLSLLYGLTFDTIATSQTIRKEVANQGYQSIFTFQPFLTNITAVTVKSITDSSYSKVLIDQEDYNTYSLVNYSTLISTIELKCEIKAPYYLSVNADQGFLATTPRILKNAIIDYLSEYTDYIDNGKANILSSETDESKVSYSATSQRKFYEYENSPLSYPAITNALSIIFAC